MGETRQSAARVCRMNTCCSLPLLSPFSTSYGKEGMLFFFLSSYGFMGFFSFVGGWEAGVSSNFEISTKCGNVYQVASLRTVCLWLTDWCAITSSPRHWKIRIIVFLEFVYLFIDKSSTHRSRACPSFFTFFSSHQSNRPGVICTCRI